MHIITRLLYLQSALVRWFVQLFFAQCFVCAADKTQARQSIAEARVRPGDDQMRQQAPGRAEHYHENRKSQGKHVKAKKSHKSKDREVLIVRAHDGMAACEYTI